MAKKAAKTKAPPGALVPQKPPDVPAMIVTENPKFLAARKTIEDAVRDAQTLEAASGKAYATAIKAVIQGMEVGLTRRDIAVAIRKVIPPESKRILVEHQDGAMATVEKVRKGAAARYIALARWQRQEWLKKEKPATEGVTIRGKTFKSPLQALESGEVTFSGAYRAWRQVVTPYTMSFKALPKDAWTSAAERLEGLSVSMVVGEVGQEKLERVRVTENPEAFAGVISCLLASSLGRKLLNPKTRTAVLNQLQAKLKTPAVELEEQEEQTGTM